MIIKLVVSNLCVRNFVYVLNEKLSPKKTESKINLFKKFGKGLIKFVARIIL